MIFQGTDLKSVKVKSKYLQEKELKQWKSRELAIKDLQDRRLQIIAQLLREHHFKIEKLREHRIADRVNRVELLRDKCIENTTKLRVKAVRDVSNQKLLAIRAAGLVGSLDIKSTEADTLKNSGVIKGVKRDILSEYIDPASKAKKQQ